jgi:hypothetical protein
MPYIGYARTKRHEAFRLGAAGRRSGAADRSCGRCMLRRFVTAFNVDRCLVRRAASVQRTPVKR